MKTQHLLLPFFIVLFSNLILYSQSGESLVAYEVIGTVYISVPNEKLKPGYSFSGYSQLTFAETDALVFYTDTQTNSNYSLDFNGDSTPINDATGGRLQEEIENVVTGKRKKLPAHLRKALKNTGSQGGQGKQNN